MTARKQQPGPGDSAAFDSLMAVNSLRAWYLEAEAAAGIAMRLADTPFVPDSLKRYQPPASGNPRDHGPLDLEATVAVVTAALLTGTELGLSPMASLRAIDVIRGVPALRAITLRALVQSRGHDIRTVSSSDTRAVVRACRAGETQPVESVWTLDRAKKMGLYPGREDSQWRKMPQNMLVARATAEAARWIAADVIMGVPYVAEELADAPYEVEADVLGEQPPAPALAPKTARRKSPVRLRAVEAAPPAPAPEPAPETGPPPPAPVPPEPGPEPPMITPAQRARLWSGFRDGLGITERAEIHKLISDWAGRDVKSSNDLTNAEAHAVITRLDEAIIDRARHDGQQHPAAGDSAGASP